MDVLNVETIPTAKHCRMTCSGESCRFQSMRRLLLFVSVFLLGSYSYSESPPDGPYETFYSNGQLKEKGKYKDGERDGAWEQFYDAGQLKSKGNFKNGEGLLKWFDKGGRWRIGAILKITFQRRRKPREPSAG